MLDLVKKIFLIGLLLAPYEVSAEVTPFMQRRCNELFLSLPVEIEINYDLGKLEYDSSKSNDELAELYSAHNSGRKAENTVNGLTVQNGYFRLTLDIENRTIRRGYKCYYPSKITIDTGYKDSTVYLAKNLKSGSCRFELTKRHEYTHLALGKAGLEAQIALIRKMLPSIIKKHGAIVSEESKDLAEQEIFDAYNKDIGELRQMTADITSKEQQKLDTKENYMRETKLCPAD